MPADENTANAPSAADRPPLKKRHGRAILASIVASQLVLAVLTAGGVWWLHNSLNDNIAAGMSIQHKTDKSRTGPQGALNILVMGSDSRAGEGNDIDAESQQGQRADTTILLHVSSNRANAYGVSLPRDAMVQRPDCDVDGETVPGSGDDLVMFNTAFAEGGPQCTVQMVESLTGVFIDHFLVLDFNGFKDMVNAVDGVEVCLPEAVDDPDTNIKLAAGTQELDGDQALSYVRERDQLSVTGDIGRMTRQQAFIGSMVNKVFSAGTLSQPTRIYDFLYAVTGSIQVDQGLDKVGKLFDLARQFQNTGLDRIRFITVPIAEYEPDPNRLIWTSDADQLWQRINDDKQLGKDFSANSLSAADPVGPDSDPSGSPSASPSDGATEEPDDSSDDVRRAAGLCT